MRIFSMADYPQGSPAWHELRRGLVTASVADMILTPVHARPSAQQAALLDQLIADIVNPSPNWFSESLSKPPNKWMDDGAAREAEAKRWYSMDRGTDFEDVGFIRSDCGRYGCSPDMVLPNNAGAEVKCPMLKTMAGYLRDHKLLLDAYRPQVHFQLWTTGWDYVDLVAYAPPLEPVVVTVTRGPYTDALAEETLRFLDLFDQAKRRMGIPDLVAADGEILTRQEVMAASPVQEGR